MALTALMEGLALVPLMKEGRPLIIINGIYDINVIGSINDVCLHMCRNSFSLPLNALMALVPLMTWTETINHH